MKSLRLIFFTFITIITLISFGGIARSQTLFGLADSCGEDSAATLYTINTSTGAATAVGTGVGFERCGGMDFDSTGTLFAACERNDGSDLIVLITINTSTGAGSEIGRFCGLGGGATDLSVKNSDDVLYGAVFDGSTGGCSGGLDLATLDKGTGAESLIGTFTGFTGNPNSNNRGDAMAFSGIDTLFLGAGGDEPQATLYTVNQSTAVLTNICDINTPSSFDDKPRPNAMDFHPVSDVLFATIVNGKTSGGDNREWFLTNINTTTCDVDVIGQTVDCIDAIAFGPEVLTTVPTLSEWGLIAMAGILGIVGFMVMRRRKITA